MKKSRIKQKDLPNGIKPVTGKSMKDKLEYAKAASSKSKSPKTN